MGRLRFLLALGLGTPLAGCGDMDWGGLLQRTASNTAASYCRTALNCHVDKPDALDPMGRNKSPLPAYQP